MLKRDLVFIGVFIAFFSLGPLFGYIGEWLRIPVSPAFNGMGETGCSLPSSDIYSFYFNPANGIFDLKGMNINHSHTKIRWFSGINIFENYFRFAYATSDNNYSFGFLVGRNRINYGEVTVIDTNLIALDTIKARSYSDVLNFSSLFNLRVLNIPFLLSVGVTAKSIRENLLPPELKSKALDLGVIFSLPICYSGKAGKFGYDFIPAFGYSLLNLELSRKVSHNREEESEEFCFPRMERIGLSFTLRIKTVNGLNILEYRGVRESEDLLLEEKYGIYPVGVSDSRYQSPLEDIKFARNVIQSHPDSGISIKRGYEIGFFNLFYFRAGRKISLSSSLDLNQTGFSISSSGVFDLLFLATGVDVFKTIRQFVEVKYDESWWTNVNPGGLDLLNGRRFKAFTFSLRDIDRLFKNNWIDREKVTGSGICSNVWLRMGLGYFAFRFPPGEKVKMEKVPSFTFGVEKRIKFMDVGLAFYSNKIKQYFQEDSLYIPVSAFMPAMEFFSSVRLRVLKNVYGRLEIGCFKELSIWMYREDEYEKYTGLLNYDQWGASLKPGFDVILNNRYAMRLIWKVAWRANYEIPTYIGIRKISGPEISILIRL